MAFPLVDRVHVHALDVNATRNKLSVHDYATPNHVQWGPMVRPLLDSYTSRGKLVISIGFSDVGGPTWWSYGAWFCKRVKSLVKEEGLPITPSHAIATSNSNSNHIINKLYKHGIWLLDSNSIVTHFKFSIKP